MKSAAVAEALYRAPASLSPIRDGVIRRALRYVPERGAIDFTVPLFGEYMKRRLPEEAEG